LILDPLVWLGRRARTSPWRSATTALATILIVLVIVVAGPHLVSTLRFTGVKLSSAIARTASVSAGSQSDAAVRILSYPWAVVSLKNQESGHEYRFTAPMRAAEPVQPGRYEILVVQQNAVRMHKTLNLESQRSYQVRIKLHEQTFRVDEEGYNE
jgi:hypothetical protein